MKGGKKHKSYWKISGHNSLKVILPLGDVEGWIHLIWAYFLPAQLILVQKME